jgi:ATP-dependent DNA helicase PIF1
MGHKYAFEAIDRTFRDLMGSLDKDMENVMFGGKVILLGGDFRQV